MTVSIVFKIYFLILPFKSIGCSVEHKAYDDESQDTYHDEFFSSSFLEPLLGLNSNNLFDEVFDNQKANLEEKDKVTKEVSEESFVRISENGNNKRKQVFIDENTCVSKRKNIKNEDEIDVETFSSSISASDEEKEGVESDNKGDKTQNVSSSISSSDNEKQQTTRQWGLINAARKNAYPILDPHVISELKKILKEFISKYDQQDRVKVNRFLSLFPEIISISYCMLLKGEKQSKQEKFLVYSINLFFKFKIVGKTLKEALFESKNSIRKSLSKFLIKRYAYLKETVSVYKALIKLNTMLNHERQKLRYQQWIELYEYAFILKSPELKQFEQNIIKMKNNIKSKIFCEINCLFENMNANVFLYILIDFKGIYDYVLLIRNPKPQGSAKFFERFNGFIDKLKYTETSKFTCQDAILILKIFQFYKHLYEGCCIGGYSSTYDRKIKKITALEEKIK